MEPIKVSAGLANVICTETYISSTKNQMLSYAGYGIDELMAQQVSYEEVLFLLWHLRLPTASELEAQNKKIFANIYLDEHYLNRLRVISNTHQHPMSILRTAISMLGTQTDATGTSEQVQGRMLAVVAAIVSLLQKRPILTPRQDLSYAGNFYYLLTGHLPTAAQTAIANQVLILHADHELNASTFTARVVASTDADMYSCLTAAVCALKGPLHGGANEAVFKMLTEIDQNHIDPATYIADKLAKHEKISGFGHRIYKNGDPRAKYLKIAAAQIAKDSHQLKWYQLSEQIQTYMAENTNFKPNVDFYTATIYHCMGLPADVFTLLFAVCRTGGWLAHIQEQRQMHTLIRPSSEYVGEMNRRIDERQQNAQ
ncbi:citrate/2-methylcitrate synthase [Agrilactobacillus yilanensis]|uniref:Citrate synthase n=1 Tax=Agrilactobacillus yilanensis TaxID=2485997 RepID=A0ABW4J8K9_9LACO|nr:citrate/2-methylcitrate synthase [Agrilactobacillus yilanensis]